LEPAKLWRHWVLSTHKDEGGGVLSFFDNDRAIAGFGRVRLFEF